MARAVVPSTAAAIDHANAKLFGHDGKSETPGFFAVEQYSSLHISIFIPQRHKLENSHSNFLSRRILLAYSNHSLSIIYYLFLELCPLLSPLRVSIIVLSLG